MVEQMNNGLKLIGLLVAMTVFTACTPATPEERYVLQRIPIMIQKGKPITVEVDSLSGGAVNDVGIRCRAGTWRSLTNGMRVIEVRLKASNRPATTIGGVNPGSTGTAFFGYIPDAHYLFYISGERGAKALVEITFENGPSEPTPAEIIICRTPADTVQICRPSTSIAVSSGRPTVSQEHVGFDGDNEAAWKPFSYLSLPARRPAPPDWRRDGPRSRFLFEGQLLISLV